VDQDGSLVAIGESNHQKFIGDWKFYKKGKLIAEGNYINGQQDGDWKNHRRTKEGKDVTSIVKYV
jgi:antitoxin component YwqK of YwqJK toxin-antitoxin module